jgi:hypothetical protein
MILVLLAYVSALLHVLMINGEGLVVPLAILACSFTVYCASLLLHKRFKRASNFKRVILLIAMVLSVILGMGFGYLSQ